MAWVKTGPLPSKQRLSLIVDTGKNPRLAEWIHRLPYGGVNAAVLDLLERGLDAIDFAETPARQAAPAPRGAGTQSRPVMAARIPSAPAAALPRTPAMPNQTAGTQAKRAPGSPTAITPPTTTPNQSPVQLPLDARIETIEPTDDAEATLDANTASLILQMSN